MDTGRLVLCGSSFYEQKYYFNEKQFGRLPQAVREELRIMCVLFTEDVGGALILMETVIRFIGFLKGGFRGAAQPEAEAKA